ncbi:MAG: hypothetical protein NVS4B11_34510 [Ktedonobacteraceae bacterium]
MCAVPTCAAGPPEMVQAEVRAYLLAWVLQEEEAASLRQVQATRLKDLSQWQD